MDICIAARALRNAHARAGWTSSQSLDDFINNFRQLVGEAARAYDGGSQMAIHGAILDGIGIHIAFLSYPPHIEPLVPFKGEPWALGAAPESGDAP
jgi:hypothetical protein